MGFSDEALTLEARDEDSVVYLYGDSIKLYIPLGICPRVCVYMIRSAQSFCD